MKPAIIAVDDDPQVLRAITRDLRQRYAEEYRVLRAESALEALTALDELKTRGEPVALFLSDQRMPRMDGVTFLTEARARFPDAKRALLTAYADTEAAIAAINRSQVDYYLLKPWDPPGERLYPVLDDLLEDWQSGWRPPFEGVRILGDRWSPEGHRLRDFLARNQVPYQFVDVESAAEAAELLGRVDDNRGELPLVFLADGSVLSSPDPGELADRIGLRVRATAPFYDVAIIGGGPAGLAAAVYGGSEGLRTVLIEQEAPGGQAGTSSRIENYLGFPSGLSGAELARRAVAQTRKFGVELLSPQRAVSLEIDGPYKKVTFETGDEVVSHVLMLTTGVTWRRLAADQADRFTGRGIYYGAAMTEAMGCRGEDVYIVGAGNSAGQAAMYFKDFAQRVVMLVRGDSLGSKMSRYLVDRIEATPNIEVRRGTSIAACHGEQRLEGLTLLDGGTPERVDAHFLFVFIGAEPRTEWLHGVIATDARGFVLTGSDLDSARDLKAWPLDRAPFLLESNVPGVFAAGDVRHQSVKRVASAVGEGSIAVHFIHRYLAEK
jgi:thioredoxin reductase (NADPH)